MNQSEVNSFLLCLSRLTAADNDHQLAGHNHQHPLNLTSRVVTAAATSGESDHDHDSDHNGDDQDTNGVLMAKVTAICVLFCATAICGAIPFVLNRFFKWTDNNADARSATVIKCLLYFGGGVLLCTAFLHLLPEVEETIESLQECGTLPELKFSLAELLMCMGFFAMFLIEEVIHAYIHNQRKTMEDETVAAFERGHSIRNSYLMRNSDKDQQKDDSQSEKEDFNNSISNGNGNTISKLSVQDLLTNDMESQKYQMQQNNTESTESTVPAMADTHDHNGHSHMPLGNAEDLITSSLRGLLIVLALSLHELFEGLAIGLEASATNVWFMFAAVSAHKLVLAFCVGVELIVARTRLALSIVYIFTFAFVSPIGIGIGILVTEQDSMASSIPSAILQGLACGTLLYVVFFEILSKDRAGLFGFLALFIGFGVMFGLQQIATGHEHSHGCSAPSSDSTKSLNPHSHDGHSHNDDDSSSDAQAHSLEQQLQVLRDASASLKNILSKTSK